MYESKCPDSITFIKEQLAPTYAALGSQLIVVDFIPYGIAKVNILFVVCNILRGGLEKKKTNPSSKMNLTRGINIKN